MLGRAGLALPRPDAASSARGGQVVTAGGLVFIAGMPDARLRAFDKETGELLFEALLRAASFAAPAVYEAYGRQFDCPRHARRAARVRAMPPPHLPRSDPRCEPSRRHTLVYDDTRAIEFEVTP